MVTVVIVVLMILTFGNPLLLIAAFVQQLGQERSEGWTWRTASFWIALTLASAAIAFFWAATRYGPNAYGEDDLIFRKMLRVSLAAAALALFLAVIAKSKGTKWIAFSALITPLSWFWALMMA